MTNAEIEFRKTVISLLDDADGISEDSYTNLQELEAAVASGTCEDIWPKVIAVDGRYFLPEEHGFTLVIGSAVATA